MLFVVCRLRCLLLVVSWCVLLVVCWLVNADGWLLVAMFVVVSLLSIVCRLLVLLVGSLVMVGCCLPCGVDCWLFGVFVAVFVVCCCLLCVGVFGCRLMPFRVLRVV